jgi:hypothetical protein
VFLEILDQKRVSQLFQEPILGQTPENILGHRKHILGRLEPNCRPHGIYWRTFEKNHNNHTTSESLMLHEEIYIAC